MTKHCHVFSAGKTKGENSNALKTDRVSMAQNKSIVATPQTGSRQLSMLAVALESTTHEEPIYRGSLTGREAVQFLLWMRV